jgi:hypothetical protein
MLKIRLIKCSCSDTLHRHGERRYSTRFGAETLRCLPIHASYLARYIGWGNLIGVLAKAFLLLARNPEPQPRGSPFYEKDFASARLAMSTMWGHQGTPLT